jgi:molybdopterin synthase catalytic subunit
MPINEEHGNREDNPRPMDKSALFRHESGGAAHSAAGPPLDYSKCVRIVHQKIDASVLLEKIKGPADGAVVVFEGVVRDNSRGRRTLFLDYEAYEEMAVKQMNGLLEQALSQFHIRQVAMVHRVGRLQIGEISVVVVVASPHRAAAFDACRWLIDTLKRTVPIWKKEYFDDGAVWADGEPFPAEIQKSQGHPEKPASN